MPPGAGGAILSRVAEADDPEQDRSSSAPVEPRIGDAEREQAIGYLQEHMAQGRLDGAEFDERLSRAFAARTAADLRPLFEDLPEPRPAVGLAPASPPPAPPWATAAPARTQALPLPVPEPPGSPPTPRGVVVAMAAVWPAAILLSVLTSFQFWWIWVVAGVVHYLLHQIYGPKPPDTSSGPPAIGR
jgi:hypothetical protein